MWFTKGREPLIAVVRHHMSAPPAQPSRWPPWYLWLLVPIVFPIALVIMGPLALLALLSVPYFRVFPDHHAHLYDFNGTPRQREMLMRWRASYSRLGFAGRLARCFKVRRRRQRLAEPRNAADAR